MCKLEELLNVRARGDYHCLQIEPGIIQDLAGTPFPGLAGHGLSVCVGRNYHSPACFASLFDVR